MKSQLFENLKKENEACETLKQNGYDIIFGWGKYIIINGVYYKNCREACEKLLSGVK